VERDGTPEQRVPARLSRERDAARSGRRGLVGDGDARHGESARVGFFAASSVTVQDLGGVELGPQPLRFACSMRGGASRVKSGLSPSSELLLLDRPLRVGTPTCAAVDEAGVDDEPRAVEDFRVARDLDLGADVSRSGRAENDGRLLERTVPARRRSWRS
jgi:hypothetical protein